MSKEDKVQDEELLNQEEQQVENSNEEPQEEVIELSKEESLEIQVKEATDKYLRLYSEFDNFRKRTQKEKNNYVRHMSNFIGANKEDSGHSRFLIQKKHMVTI